jgi:hypothetical protein
MAYIAEKSNSIYMCHRVLSGTRGKQARSSSRTRACAAHARVKVRKARVWIRSRQVAIRRSSHRARAFCLRLHLPRPSVMGTQYGAPNMCPLGACKCNAFSRSRTCYTCRTMVLRRSLYLFNFFM